MQTDFFIQRPSIYPTIYAYVLDGVASHKGYIKVGYTERDVEKRLYEQLHTSGVPYKILLKESAMCSDGTCFTDRDVHAILRRKGLQQLKEGEDRNEWFRCSIDNVMAAITELRTGIRLDGNRTQAFKMRPEQQYAVKRTIEYYASSKKDEPNRAPKFLWNAKMRFGKTFASYQLAKKDGLYSRLGIDFQACGGISLVGRPYEPCGL